MADETPQAESPVTETPEAPMPSATETSQKTPEVSTTVEPQDGLPVETSDRTKHEFDKLQSQLREERQRREALEGAFKTMQPKAQGLAPIIDPDTGYLNENALKERDNLLLEAQQRAAKTETDFQQFRKAEEERVAYDAHPWLNPKDEKNFDQERYNLAVGVSLSSMVNPQSFGGKQLGLKDAGDFVANLTKSQVAKAQEEAAKQAIEQLSPKEQASLEATGSSMRRTEVADNLATLRSRTRRGDISAAMERLKAIGTQT